MKMKFLSLSLLFALAGCLSPAPRVPENWTIDCTSIVPRSQKVPAANSRDSLRLAQVSVRAPFDGRHLAVLRKDGSIAFDPLNGFAANPAALIRGAAEDCIAASGRFQPILAANSAAQTRYSLEIAVTRLALECRKEKPYEASVALDCVLLDGRKVLSVSHGEGAIPVTDGNYSNAFSRALASALDSALTDKSTSK